MIYKIQNYPWDQNGYMPEAEAETHFTSDALRVRLRAYESSIKAVCMEHNGHVYKDSCLEVFINPYPEKGNQYLNFEINPIGTMHLGFGEAREGRKLIDPSIFNIFDIKTTVKKNEADTFNGPYWEAAVSIPFDFLMSQFGADRKITEGSLMKGNFYKCGDEFTYPHYGCWSLVKSQVPDFHRPESFGFLQL